MKAKSYVILYWLFLLMSSVLTPAYATDKKAPDTYEEKLLHSINQYRGQQNNPPLLFDKTLYMLAKAHSHYMRSTNKLDHMNFEGRYDQSKRRICVENVGWNYTTPEAQFEAWKASKGHQVNMLNKQIRRAGISKVGSFVTFFACD